LNQTVTSEAHAPRGFASHFVESVVLTWIGNLLRIVIGMVALRLVTSSIPEAQLGAYWILTTVSSLLSNLADLGLGIGAVRHLPIVPDRDAARRLMHTILLLRLAFLAVLCGLIFVCKPWVLQIFNAQTIEKNYSFLYIFVTISSLGELYTNFLQGLNRFRAIAFFAFASSLARLVLIVLFVGRGKLGINGLFLAEAVSLLLAMLFSAWVSGHGLRLRAARAEASEQLRFGFPLYLNTILFYTASRINTVMIGSISPVTAGAIGRTEAVSYFTVASRVPDQLQMILRTYNFVYLPNMTRFLVQEDKSQARHLLAASLRLMSYTFAMLTLLLSLFRHEVLAVVAPPSYQQAANAMPLVLGGLTFASLGSIMGSTIVALGDSRTPVKINLWTSSLAFALNFFFIRRWGFMGAAWATLSFNVVGYAITDAVLSRRIRPENRSYLGILAFLGALLAVGFHAGVAMRIVLGVVGAAGSLLLSRGLRDDVGRVWTARRRRAAPAALDPSK
jgi:O-antigen/teichoic acid export membrane protein